MLRKNNTALFAMYAGDFELAREGSAGRFSKLNPGVRKSATWPSGCRSSPGQAAEAEETYGKLATLPGSAAWFAAAGLADLAMHEGRLADAASILEAAIKSESGRVAAGQAGRHAG